MVRQRMVASQGVWFRDANAYSDCSDNDDFNDYDYADSAFEYISINKTHNAYTVW